ncbi:hypothetical protein MAR_002883 [Mya arenaria]|uniref:Transposase n=1 Tax=Mya arenaria TaxID=6604 RepID=A0ABY7G4F5_MYAAR|nr:hypothetical protein MAR_002883 [Mya arenaria]
MAATTARNTVGRLNRAILSQRVLNRLRAVSLLCRRQLRDIILTARPSQARLVLTRRHLPFTRADLGNALFIDETSITPRGYDTCDCVLRLRDERNHENLRPCKRHTFTY